MIELKVPFLEKDHAKSLGARWNAASKCWFIPEGLDPKPFARWLPQEYQLESKDVIQLAEDKHILSLAQFLEQVSSVISVAIPSGVWISAELSEVREHKGHLFITLVEHNQQGLLVARSQARVWQEQAGIILNKFKQQTGSRLEPGIKILCKVSTQFHAQYGLNLFIDDIDPAYTLGDMAIKLLNIQKMLIKENLINKNKNLPRAIDFLNVAVISPKDAAGLGDFRREANILEKNKLCNFVYYTAVFQGKSAAKSIIKALEQAIVRHAKLNFDAIVIIRGGGAVSDLAWLNDELLAKSLCLCPIPIMAGIGHKKDYTIINDVSNETFDTPSKVIQKILNTIMDNAHETATNYQEIKTMAINICQIQLKNLAQLQNSIQQSLEHVVVLTDHQLQKAWEEVMHCSLQLPKLIEKKIQLLITEIISQDPQKIINQGYCLVRNAKNNVITTKNKAQQESKLLLEFIDGKLEVKI